MWILQLVLNYASMFLKLPIYQSFSASSSCMLELSLFGRVVSLRTSLHFNGFFCKFIGLRNWYYTVLVVYVMHILFA